MLVCSEEALMTGILVFALVADKFNTEWDTSDLLMLMFLVSSGPEGVGRSRFA